MDVRGSGGCFALHIADIRCLSGARNRIPPKPLQKCSVRSPELQENGPPSPKYATLLAEIVASADEWRGETVAGELFDQAGNRKYLTHDERKAFLKAADRAPREVRTFCHLIHFSGCRISEALALTYDRVDFANGTEPQEAPGRRLPLSPRAPHPARRAGPGA